MPKVITIEGIGPVNADKLITAGVRTTDALLRRGATPSGRKAIADATGIDPTRILDWVNRADLMRIRGVGEEYSDLLESAGVDTVKELATRRPDHLHARMLEVNASRKLVRRPPTLNAVEAWIAGARTLPPVVTY
jgi:predicted flap endonuclease-1-like 5' DNA nuclease